LVQNLGAAYFIVQRGRGSTEKEVGRNKRKLAEWVENIKGKWDRDPFTLFLKVFNTNSGKRKD